MQRLNPFDAISPAFSRAHALLFRPFHWRRSWKLMATAYLAQIGSFFLPIPLALLFLPFLLPQGSNLPWAPLFAGTGVYCLIYFVFFYLGARLGLVEFEIVVTLAKRIRPMWRKYPAKVWPWIAAKVCVGLAAAAVATPILFQQLQSLVATMQTLPWGSQKANPEDMAAVMSVFFSFYFVMLLVFLGFKTLGTLLDDFALPFFLLEDLPVLKSIERAYAIVAAEPFPCIGYLLLKLFLALVGSMAAGVASQICVIPLAVVFVPCAFLISYLGHLGGAYLALAILFGIVVGMAAVASLFYLQFGLYGYLMILLDCYTLYFLGGRYALLGSLLEPGPGGPFTPPPVFPSPEERKENDKGGPSLPMNPAVA